MPKGSRQKIKKVRIQFSDKDKWDIAQYQKQIGLFNEIICKKCGRGFPIDIMEVDHIKPVSKGGKDNPSNLQLLCHTCNKKKGAKIVKPRRPSGLFGI
jgi:5-methylcytosine-specific restriction endonuclease McrA